MGSEEGSREVRPLVGAPAPDFRSEGFVSDGDGEFAEYELADFRGEWLLLFFYPADFSPICHSEINRLERRREDLDRMNCAVLGVSTDTVYTHRAWVRSEQIGELGFPLISDSNHRISRSYRVLDPDRGSALRAHVLIDPEGVVQFRSVQPGDVDRDIDLIVGVLERLQKARIAPSPEDGDGELSLD